jgi:hypothetical protein
MNTSKQGNKYIKLRMGKPKQQASVPAKPKPQASSGFDDMDSDTPF